MHKIAAVVILYKPLHSVKYNILSYIDDIDYLYIVDNSPNHSSVIFDLGFYSYKIKILHYGSNIGVSSALNLAIDFAKKDNYKWLLTFDQDTYFKNNDCNLFISKIFDMNLNNVAIISPLHNKKFIKQEKTIDINKVDVVMTSANCINIDIISEIGGFDDKLFIDEVDHEICLRSNKYNYNILRYNNIAVNHTLGVSHKLFSKIKIYHPVRLYYMIRNYLYIRKKYKKYYIDFFNKRDIYMIRFFLYQIIFCNHKIKCILYIIHGINDYCKNRFGKLDKDV